MHDGDGGGGGVWECMVWRHSSVCTEGGEGAVFMMLVVIESSETALQGDSPTP